MASTNPHSSDFSYKKYSLEQLDNWVHDALSCEDLTPQDIYNTIVKCVDESVEYHKKNLTKTVQLLSLLKGNGSVNLEVTDEDWADFWEECYYPEEIKDTQEISQHYTDEELNAMCNAAAEKEKQREYNLREAEYYTKRAELDAHEQQAKAVAEMGHSKYYYNTGRNKTHDQMIAEGWQMTDDGFWIKETDKGTLSISS